MRIRVSEIDNYRKRLETVKDLVKPQDPDNRFAYAVYKNYKKLETLSREYVKDPNTPEFEQYTKEFGEFMESLKKLSESETPPTQEELREKYTTGVVELNKKHSTAIQQKQDMMNKEIDFDVYTCYEGHTPNMTAAQMSACEFFITEIETVKTRIQI